MRLKGFADIATVRGYDNNIEAIKRHIQLCCVYGIKKESFSSKLQFFHIIQVFHLGLAHDLFERFAIDFISKLIVYLVKSKYFTLEDINEKVSLFNHSESHKKNKSRQFKLKPLSQFRVKKLVVKCGIFLGSSH